jgi:hypothetical protein
VPVGDNDEHMKWGSIVCKTMLSKIFIKYSLWVKCDCPELPICSARLKQIPNKKKYTFNYKKTNELG